MVGYRISRKETTNTLPAESHLRKALRRVLLDRVGFIKAPGLIINKQLLDEVEHDIMSYQNRGLCYLPKPKAEADNTDTWF